jgi:hypothetical protein
MFKPTFDEFHAVRQRKRNMVSSPQDEAAPSAEGLRANSVEQERTKKGNLSKRRGGGLGLMMEVQEAQVLMLSLIFADFLACLAELIILPKLDEGPISSLAARLLQSFSGLATLFFSLEMIAIIGTFRLKCLQHLGYMLDAVLVALLIAQQLGFVGIEVRLCGALRMWRLARLFESMMGRVSEDTVSAKGEVERLRRKMEVMSEEVGRLTLRIKAEQEARRKTEQMLQSYKDEVDTLNEALKIAAYDIAEAAASDMEDEDDSGAESDGELSEQARVNKLRRAAAVQQVSTPSNRIIVNDDGTWQS